MKNSEFSKKQILFSGVAPSGTIHIGNYLGAIKNWVKIQGDFQSIFCVVDYHAITAPQEPKKLRKKILEVAAIYLAAGIDPEKSIIFIQSHNQDHVDLAWILNTITPLGELERMTQFKDKARKQKSVLAGLLNYPVLMAADILLYKTNAVPVGEDQLQHIEFTRMIAEKFNKRFRETFPLPEPFINKTAARIMGLDNPGVKMSKSAEELENYIALLDEPEEIRRKIKIALTDSGKEIKYNPSEKPAISNLIAIYSLFSEIEIEKVEVKYNNKSYSEFKTELAELIIEKLKPLQEKYNSLMKKPDDLMKILENGAKKAKAISSQTLKEVHQKIGFI